MKTLNHTSNYMSKKNGKLKKTLPVKKFKDFDDKKLIKKDTEDDVDMSVSFSNNAINIENVYKFIDLFFKQKNVMFTHLYNSYDKLLDEDIPNFLKSTNNIFFEKPTSAASPGYGIR